MYNSCIIVSIEAELLLIAAVVLTSFEAIQAVILVSFGAPKNNLKGNRILVDCRRRISGLECEARYSSASRSVPLIHLFCRLDTHVTVFSWTEVFSSLF